MVDFYGWEMPLRYRSIPAEHNMVRQSAGLFDLCHMGRLELRGDGAEDWLQGVLTADVSAMPAGRARYSLITDDSGAPIDDAVVYRLPEEWLLVVNASNRLRVIDWLEEHRPAAAAAAELVDRTADWAMIAIQGPRSAGIVASLIDEPEKDWEALRYYQIMGGRFSVAPGKEAGVPLRVSRTGYTGEDGFEVYLAREEAEALWRRALELGGEHLAPAGLGARDTLRLEAGMPLYGNEIDETTQPFEAGLGFAVKLQKEADFPGKERLRALKQAGNRRNLRGFRVAGRRVARHGMKIYQGDRQVGYVTSGAPSPTLGFPIAMGYLDWEAEKRAVEGRDAESVLTVDVRGRREELALVELPFFSRTRKKTQ